MKNLVILFLMFMTFRAYAQEYPLGTDLSNLPPYSYIKDTNNEYNKYVGLWKGTWNGKTIYLELKKIKYLNEDTIPYYKDKILGERKIIASNGTVEIDRISNFDYQHSEIWGMGIPTGLNSKNYPSLMFFPKNMCDMFVRLVITDISSTQMTLHMTDMMGYKKANCIHDAYFQQYGEYPLNFPKDIVLTEQ